MIIIRVMINNINLNVDNDNNWLALTFAINPRYINQK